MDDLFSSNPSWGISKGTLVTVVPRLSSFLIDHVCKNLKRPGVSGISGVSDRFTGAMEFIGMKNSVVPEFQIPSLQNTIVSAANIYESLGRLDQTSAGSPWQPMACYHNWQVLKRFRARAPSTHKFSSSFLTGFSPFFTHSPDSPRIFTWLKSENIKGRNFPATFLRKELLKLIQQSKDKAIKARIGKGRASKTFPKSILQIPLTHLVRRNDPYMMKLSLHPKNS